MRLRRDSVAAVAMDDDRTMSKNNCTAIVERMCTLGRVVLPNGTAHRPDGRLLLHHLPERFAVREMKILEGLAYLAFLDELACLDFLET